MSAAKKIILLLWLLLVASLGNASASMPGATENRVWQKSFETLETRQAEPLQTLGGHQENEGAGYDYAVDSLLAAEGTATQLEFDFVNNLSPKPAINWAKEAPNYGFAGEPAPASLVPGTLVDRFGYPGGTFVSPKGTPFIQRSLAPGTQYSLYSIYQVLKSIDVNTGQIAPAFGMPGGGTQFQLPSSVQSLIDSGHLGIH